MRAKARPAGDAEPESVPLDPKKIVFTLSGQDRVRDCLRASPEVPGTVTLRWAVATSGDVSDVEASTTLPDDVVATCLVEQLRKLSFGRVPRRAHARWTFVRYLDGLMSTQEREKLERKKRRKRPARRGAQEDPPRPPGYDDGVRIAAGSEGWLEPAAVEQRVHGSFQLYAHCLREGFARNPDVSGIIKLRVVIDRDGSVRSVRDAGSDLPDGEAVSCVAEGFYAMSFPRPSGGDVEVLYPVLFNVDD